MFINLNSIIDIINYEKQINLLKPNQCYLLLFLEPTTPNKVNKRQAKRYSQNLIVLKPPLSQPSRYSPCTPLSLKSINLLLNYNYSHRQDIHHLFRILTSELPLEASPLQVQLETKQSHFQFSLALTLRPWASLKLYNDQQFKLLLKLNNFGTKGSQETDFLGMDTYSIKFLYHLQSLLYKMASLIQLDSLSLLYLTSQTETKVLHSQPTNPETLISRLQTCFSNFYKPQFQSVDSKNEIVSFHFLVPFIQRMFLLYNFQVSKTNQLKKIRFKLKKEAGPPFASSNQMIRNFCKTLNYMNLMLFNCHYVHMIDLKNGEISCKIPISGIPLNNKVFLRQVKSVVQKSLSFMVDMTALILYNCNPQALKYISEYASPYIKKVILGQKGELMFYTQIKEFLPFMNTDIQTQEGRSQKQKKSFFPDLRHSKDLLQHSFREYQKIQKLNILYSFTNYNQLQQPIIQSINRQALKAQLVFPTARDEIKNQSSIQQINIVSEQRQKQKVFKEGLKAKVSLIPLKYELVSSVSNTNQGKVKNEEVIELNQNKQHKAIISKSLILKQTTKKNDPSKRLYIKYEKQIIEQLCNEFCIYFPKYYQASPNNPNYKDQILMDPIGGPSLHQEVQIKKLFLGPTSKIRILMHLSNALRFLDKKQIAHIDLSPNNILIVNEYMVKIIDFGEAYSQKLTPKYLAQKSAKNTFKYKPWKTFLYSSPQTYSRSSNFSSKQDIYSLGIMMFKMLFGFHILNCGDKTIEHLYKNKEYAERMFFVPELGYDLGNHQVFTIISSLIFRMLSSDEKIRPLASWSHLVLKRILIAMRP